MRNKLNKRTKVEENKSDKKIILEYRKGNNEKYLKDYIKTSTRKERERKKEDNAIRECRRDTTKRNESGSYKGSRWKSRMELQGRERERDGQPERRTLNLTYLFLHFHADVPLIAFLLSFFFFYLFLLFPQFDITTLYRFAILSRYFKWLAWCFIGLLQLLTLRWTLLNFIRISILDFYIVSNIQTLLLLHSVIIQTFLWSFFIITTRF